MEINDRIELQRFITRLEEFVALQADCTVRQVIAFLVVALNPGINITQLSQRCGTTLASASRHYRTFCIEELGEKGLVTSGYTDGRTKALLITDNGKRLVGILARRTHLACTPAKESV